MRCKSTDWALLGNIAFFVAAALWLVAPILCFGDKDECSEVEMAATGFYVVNCLLLYVDWFVQRREGFSSVFGQRVLLTQTRRSTLYYWILLIDWYLLSNSVFLIGCVGDFLTSYYSYFDVDDLLANLWYLLASCLWMLSAAVDFYGLLLDMRTRRALDAAVLLTVRPACPQPPRHEFSYQMLGAMMFFAANACYVVSCVVCWYDYHLLCDIAELCGATLFVLYSLVLFIDIRRAYKRPESDTKALLATRSEYVDEHSDDDSADLQQRATHQHNANSIQMLSVAVDSKHQIEVDENNESEG
jgi:hypothetical protein